jgi:AcrR family transcriptional regulator
MKVSFSFSMTSLSLASRAAERPLAARRARAEEEVRVLVSAALRVLTRGSPLTVAAVLDEAGLSTRAFYRHFPGKDELLLAVYEHHLRRARERLARALGAARGHRGRLEAWVDDALSFAFHPRRAAVTRVLDAEAARLQFSFPSEFATIGEAGLAELRAILRRGRERGSFPDADPEADARTIHAVVWSVNQARLRGEPVTREQARAHVLRFCLPALGVGRPRRGQGPR